MDDQKSLIHSACRQILRPLASMLLRCGMTWKEFSDLSKSVFVQAATEEYGIKGRPTNISRVAVMTGLTRKEVRRIRGKIDSGDHSVVVKSTPLAGILHRWHAEPEFLDAKGRPARLPFSGETGSFTNLTKRFGGDIPPGAMRTELKRIGAVRECENGDLEVVHRAPQAEPRRSSSRGPTSRNWESIPSAASRSRPGAVALS